MHMHHTPMTAPATLKSNQSKKPIAQDLRKLGISQQNTTLDLSQSIVLSPTAKPSCLF